LPEKASILRRAGRQARRVPLSDRDLSAKKQAAVRADAQSHSSAEWNAAICMGTFSGVT
jgi:hypothetical protein